MPDERQANAEAKWELVIDGDARPAFGCVHRLRVPGGWIYRLSMTERGGHNPTLSAVFVPEPLQGAPQGLGTSPLYTARVAGDA